VLGALPEPLALGFGELLGWIAGTVLRIRARTVRENLELAFPERDSGWRRRVARASYRHLGREGAATFRLGAATPERVRAATEVEGLERVRDAVAAGRGVVVVTGHLGNWEIGGAAVAVRGVPVDAVALVQANPLFDRELARTRARLGMRVIARGAAPREVLRSLRAGRLAALVADQNDRRGGLFVDFLGVAAATFRGPALFALRTGAPLFLGVALRRSRHPQRYRIVLEEVRVEPSGDLERDVERLTAAHADALARWVRAAPEQYFWQHRRWKTRPAQEGEGRDRGIAWPGGQEPGARAPV
jgi:KDO2-lipid IV(A) lauroyltransferase